MVACRDAPFGRWRLPSPRFSCWQRCRDLPLPTRRPPTPAAKATSTPSRVRRQQPRPTHTNTDRRHTATPTDDTPATPTDDDTQATPTDDTTPSSSTSPSPTAEPSSTDEPTHEGCTARSGRAQLVPPATGNNAVITVKVGGDRSGVSGVTSLAGVVLGFYDAATGGTAGLHLHVRRRRRLQHHRPRDPDRGRQPGPSVLGSPDQRPIGLVHQRHAAHGPVDGGRHRRPRRTGSRPGRSFGPARPTPPPRTSWRTPGRDNRSASGGVWQNSRNNPVLPSTCGLRVGLVLDLSGSTASALPQLKTAANTFVDSLVGTPSQMSLFSFSVNSPAAGATQNYPSLTPVSTQTQADAFKARYASLDLEWWDELGPGARRRRGSAQPLRRRGRDHRRQPDQLQQPAAGEPELQPDP